MNIVNQLAAAAALSVLTTTYAFAQSTTFQNGSFTNGLTNWSTAGDVLATTTGRRIAILSNASTDFQDDFPLAAGFNNNSGTAAIDFFFSNNLAGVPVQSLDNFGGTSYEGSAIRQNFMATAGNQLTVNFDWAFLSADTTNADFGFVAINDRVVSFVNINSNPLASRFTGSFGDFNNVTWSFTNNSYTYIPTSSGAVSLVIGVVDILDSSGTSELRIDNVSVSAVPEPEAFAMLLAGLGLVGGVAARRRRTLQQSQPRQV
jgi:PEP-CTERM motif